MACDPLISDGFVFPRRAANRPALPRIAYRIGRYAEFLEAMLRHIDAAEPLSAWTHRGADDPGIALIEGAAILGDILSFYQEHYANEAYLRTARWRESVAELVRLTGYRLAPGIGGRATFAFELRGTRPVTIREGFPIKADLRDVPAPADFQIGGGTDRVSGAGAFSSVSPAYPGADHRQRHDDDRAHCGRRRKRCAQSRGVRSQSRRQADADAGRRRCTARAWHGARSARRRPSAWPR